MFCTSLRKRADLRLLLPELLNSTKPKLRESKLQTHDLALPLPSQTQSQHHTLRLLVLTPSSLSSSEEAHTIARLEHFSALTGGNSIAVALLLCTSSPTPLSASITGIHALSSFQLLLLTPLLSNYQSCIPIFPIPSTSVLLPSLTTYISTLTHYTSHSLTPPPISPRAALLPYATASAPQHPLPEHEANVLSDICGSLADVARLAETERGRTCLEEWVGSKAGGVIGFWEGEREV